MKMIDVDNIIKELDNCEFKDMTDNEFEETYLTLALKHKDEILPYIEDIGRKKELTNYVYYALTDNDIHNLKLDTRYYYYGVYDNFDTDCEPYIVFYCEINHKVGSLNTFWYNIVPAIICGEV